MKTAVAFDQVQLRRDGAAILDVPTWSVLPGERWVVMGPNGCGKTTLVLAILGRLHPWSGRVSVLGLTAGQDDIQPLRIRVAFSGDALDPLVDPAISCQELVSTGFVGTLGRKFDAPTARQESISRQELRHWGLAGLERRPIGKLSLGQRRRAWLARALAPRPSLLVLDEPCAGLDPCAREEFMEHLDEVSRRRPELPMILVSHHVEEIPGSFTHALLLRDGATFRQGPIEQVVRSSHLSALYDRPATLIRRGGRRRLVFG